jgi:hypothetical protein
MGVRTLKDLRAKCCQLANDDLIIHADPTCPTNAVCAVDPLCTSLSLTAVLKQMYPDYRYDFSDPSIVGRAYMSVRELIFHVDDVREAAYWSPWLPSCDRLRQGGIVWVLDVDDAGYKPFEPFDRGPRVTLLDEHGREQVVRGDWDRFFVRIECEAA